MRIPINFLIVAIVLLLVSVGCGRAPAEAALKTAEDAVAGLGPDVQTYAGDQMSELQKVVSDARASFEEGEYSAVVEQLQGVPGRVQEVVAAATAKKEELTAAWSEVAGAAPGMVEKIGARIDELSKSSRMRRSAGLQTADVEAAKSSLEEVKGMWSQATSSFEGGDLLQAVPAAQAVKTKAEELMASLKMESEG